MTGYRDLCARCENQFPPGQVCDRCKARRPVLAWLGQLATAMAAFALALWIVHLMGFSWPT